jgi:hypothetical protein
MKITLSEYDHWDGPPGTSQCVNVSRHDVQSLDVASIRRLLAQGEYSEGGPERYVEVTHDGRHVVTMTAPEIRRCAAALRAASKRTGKPVVTGC